MTVTLNCRIDEDDYAKVTVDSDGDIRIGIVGTDHIFARPEKAAEFARGILRLVGERTNGNESPQIGDLVEVTTDRDYSSDCVGKRGVLKVIDTDSIPYLVEGVGWVVSVRKVTPTTSDNPFAAHVDEAKRLLEGTVHTGADVVALARELAGRS
ncbi:hypothetical protein ABZ445_16295 [Streptomyces chartreusis]|uniref:hypothetical protein n=1 Tax=Streptomyces chartreusis TaxID=1969 RepID=UPI0033CE6113